MDSPNIFWSERTVRNTSNSYTITLIGVTCYPSFSEFYGVYFWDSIYLLTFMWFFTGSWNPSLSLHLSVIWLLIRYSLFVIRTQFNAGSQVYPMKCENLVNSTQFEHHYQWKQYILILTFAWWSKFCIDDIVGTPKSSFWSNRKVLISTRCSKTGTSHLIVFGCRHIIWLNIIIMKW
jgi:hypothetical protein